MTRDDVIRMALEAGFAHCENYSNGWLNTMERFAALAAAAEREECAMVCDERANGENDAQWCADTIRARGAR